jgi:hypothetical protein
MRVAVVGAVLSLLLLQGVSYGEEQEQIRIITGKLTGFGDRFVVVDHERVALCDDYEVLDTLDKPIRIDGLIATETVTVSIRDACAFQVKAEQIRR